MMNGPTEMLQNRLVPLTYIKVNLGGGSPGGSPGQITADCSAGEVTIKLLGGGRSGRVIRPKKITPAYRRMLSFMTLEIVTGRK